jgi:hypothetical protein
MERIMSAKKALSVPAAALLLAAWLLGGCASPESFDPSAGGVAYQNTNYQVYQSCLTSMGQLGMASSCDTSSAGGQSVNSYGGGASNPNFTGIGAEVERGAANAIAVAPSRREAIVASYFEFMSTWPPEAQKAQRDAWLALAALAQPATGARALN